MKNTGFLSLALHGVRTAATSLAVLQMSAGQVLAAAPVAVTAPPFGGLWNSGADKSGSTATPIQHVIVIIGENRSFDHVYATYVPKNGQTVSNLLSKGIVNADGTPGPNYALTSQDAALDTTTYSISPFIKTGYRNIPPPGTGGAPTVASDT